MEKGLYSVLHCRYTQDQKIHNLMQNNKKLISYIIGSITLSMKIKRYFNTKKKKNCNRFWVARSERELYKRNNISRFGFSRSPRDL